MTIPRAGLEVRGLSIDYDGRPLLRHVDLDIASHEIVALLGPSGSGKSSLLRCIAGVQAPDAGTISWDGHDITTMPAYRRRIGLVFQDPLLFPHRTVAGNVGFGLARHRRLRRLAGPTPDRDAARIPELLELVGLPGFEQRDVSTLSGGEAQRVALARALAPEPVLLLLDEPFGALDRDLRDRLATDMRALLHDAGVPALHVTHDRQEADLIADRVVRLASLEAES
ncbi:MAG: ABC transporter ATP-binding protein [Candidatus Nanopelagicales bacterium]|jgi:thiamine transport system ATP-binding protein